MHLSSDVMMVAKAGAMAKAGAILTTVAMAKTGATLTTVAMAKAGATLTTVAMAKAGAILTTVAMAKAGAILTTVAMAMAGCDSDSEPAKTLTYTGRIVDALDSAALAGVQVCITSPSGIPCVTTDAEGRYTLSGLPAETRVTATVSKAPDYFPVHAAFITRTGDFTIDAVLLQTALVELAFSAAGVTLDTSKGAVLVRAYDPALGLSSAVAGLSGEITPADSGDGPIYNSADSIPSTATETSTSGTWAVVNLEGGTYQVKTTGTGRNCPGTFHWPGSNGAGWVETPVLAGHVTYVYVDCPTAM